MLYVCSLSDAPRVFQTVSPARVISLLSDDEPMPAFDAMSAHHHLKLYVESDASSETISVAARGRAQKIVEFVNEWDGEGDVLVHCNRGVSRSTAAAFIVMCMAKNNATDEFSLAEALRAAAPHADPCPLLVAYADDLLERDGRMIDAIESLSPPCTETAAPAISLPLGG